MRPDPGDEDDSQPQPWVTYESISGVWEGENADGRWLRVEIERDSARRDSAIGTMTELYEEDGGVRCQATLFAREADPDADPPIYRADYKAVPGPCEPEGIVRFEHDSGDGTLFTEFKPSGEESYRTAGTLRVPWVTYEPISGMWNGENVDGLWLRVEIEQDSAKFGSAIGTITEFHEEGGGVRCKATMFATDADRPIYWADYEEAVSGPCRPTGTFRFTHDLVEETLFVEFKPTGVDDYRTAGTLTREGS